MSRRLIAFSVVVPLSFATACSDEASEPNTNPGADTGTERDTGSGTDDAGAGDAATGDSGQSDAGGTEDVGPSETPPDPVAYSGGACPEFSAGANTFTSYDLERSVSVYLPDDPAGAGLVFLWHGAGDSAGNFARALGAQTIADEYDVIAVVPSASGALPFEWAIMPDNDRDIDATLFDDVVSCLDAQYDIDNTRIYTTGFSAGALWSTWLTLHRSEYLAASTTFSGGTDRTIIGYETPARQIPVLAIHGGPSDVFAVIIHFDEMTQAMTDALVADGHPVIECDHDSGHTIPFDPYEWAFPFLFSQVYGVPSLPSEPLDAPWPDWCDRLQ